MTEFIITMFILGIISTLLGLLVIGICQEMDQYRKIHDHTEQQPDHELDIQKTRQP